MESSTQRPLLPDEKHEISLIRGLIIAMAALSILVCGTRLYLRAFTIKIFGFDDWVCASALLLTQVFNGMGLATTFYGAGRHIDGISQHDLGMWLKLYYVCMCLYLYVAMSVKISLLVFFMRIFSKTWIKKTSYVLIIFLAAFTLSGSLVLALQCSPPRAAFDLSVHGKCYSQFKLFQITLYQAVVMFATDLCILFMPIPILWQLNMPIRKKFAISMIAMSGIVACVAPVVRFSTLDYLRVGTKDLPFKSASSLYWMAIEFNLGLVAGSMSTLRRLPGLRSLGSSNNHSSGAQYPPGSVELGKMGRIVHKSQLPRGRDAAAPDLSSRERNESQERIYDKEKYGTIVRETSVSVAEYRRSDIPQSMSALRKNPNVCPPGW